MWTAIALSALAVLVYTYAGYPVLVALLARLFPAHVRAATGSEPFVSVCIPAFDVAQYVTPKIESVLAQDYPGDKIEIVVYSDGSTDATEKIVAAFAARDPRVRLLRGERRLGKPTALNRMRVEARGEVLVLTDARQPLSRNAVRDLVAALSDPAVGCASGNLRLQGASGAGLYWKYENWIRSCEGRFRSMVGVTGPLYALRRGDLEEVPTDTILDDMWIPMRLRLLGKRLVFVEQAVAWDEAFEDDREFGRKVRTLAGNFQLFARMPRLLLPFVNPSWFETFSHKLLRLLCPWAIVALVMASVAGLCSETAAGARGPSLWTLRALVAGEALFALLAVAHERGGPLARIARTFVVLNAAAVLGLWRYLARAQKVTW